MTSQFNFHPIGTNSYMLKGFEVGKDIILNAFDKYKPHKPYIQKVKYQYIQDPSTQFLMLKSKKLDVGSLTPLQYNRQISKEFKKNYNIFFTPSYSYTYLGFNLKKKPFNNPLVRQAISLAIDRQKLVDILFFGYAKVCNGPFLEGAIGFNDNIKTPTVDIKKAKELLKKAGFTKNNPLTFTITTNSNNSTRNYAAQIIQHQLKKAGIIVKIKTMEWQAFLNKVVHGRKFDAILLGWGLSLMPDPFSIWHSSNDKKGGFNFIGYKNKEVDRLIELSQSIIDRKKLDSVFKKIFALIVNDNPYIFLYVPSSITVVNKKIKNVSPSIIGVMYNKIDWIKQ
jgi:peptide/nickel transport system substrate-binding protein